jgi:ArsR family transcriptional regulator
MDELSKNSCCTSGDDEPKEARLPNPGLLQLQADVMQALSHPARLCILQLLRERERCVCEFEPILRLRQPNISQHLSILRAAKLVTTRRDGLRIMYRVADPDVLRAIDLVGEIVAKQASEMAKAVNEESVAVKSA